MITHLIAVLALAGLCAGWVLVQRFIRRHDRELGERVEKQHGGCNTCGMKKDPADERRAEGCDGCDHKGLQSKG